MNQPFDTPGPARYVVGIDLGTTNCAINWVDTEEDPWVVRIFSVPQLTGPGQCESRDTLPSFHFEPPIDFRTDAIQLPWHNSPPDYIVGHFARDYAQHTMGRTISSAKSWLCHGAVDRRGAILPWHATEGVTRISPIEASSRYLRHIRAAWDAANPGFPLEEQDVVVTLPASFDEVARELTVEAAQLAGLQRIVLIEEPQAAFYAWVDAHRDDWQHIVAPGQNILILDVGGGTTDMTLIRVREREDENNRREIQFHRVAVGDHLILGGDNFDLAIARHLEEQSDASLSPHESEHLVRQARGCKERLLRGDAPEEETVQLAARGAQLLAGSRSFRVARQTITELVLDGFFPRDELSVGPLSQAAGFRKMDLPYAQDPAISHYLAKFLRDHASDELGQQVGALHAVRPDFVLFNGGVFSAPAIRRRVIEVIASWFSTDSTQWRPTLLHNQRLDQAVAHGAAYYGMVRRGAGIRISAGLARSYYVGIDGTPPQAICLVPGTAEPGDSFGLPQRQLELLVSQPAKFQLYSSSTRLTDQPGTICPVELEQMKPLPTIRTALQTGNRRGKAETVIVTLQADLSEIGTLELWCNGADDKRRWRLQFDVRAATQTDAGRDETAGESEGLVEESVWQGLQRELDETFKGDAKPTTLPRRLGEVLQLDRTDWPMPVLRRIWEGLIALKAGRAKSPQHEARWLNLVGFSLRPGYGMAVDDWRVAETWRLVHNKLTFDSVSCRNESWIVWRRLAGGLPAGQQQALCEPFLASLRALKRRLTGGGGRGEMTIVPTDSPELFRMLAAMERLPTAVKQELAQIFWLLRERKKYQSIHDVLAWSLGRLGARVPIYGPLNTLLSPSIVQPWIERWLAMTDPSRFDLLAAMQVSRVTGDRQRDVGDPLRHQVATWLADHTAPQTWQDLITQAGDLDPETEGDILGDVVPPGLRLVTT